MIDNNTKRILGKLFKRYKEEQNKSIVEIEHANISSINTFYNACKGEIIKNDQFYFDYCNFFNHPLFVHRKLEIFLKRFEIDFVNAIDFLDNKRIDDLFKEFNSKLIGFENNSIYNKYYSMIVLLYKYYILNQYLRLEDIDELLFLIDIDLLSMELSLRLLDIAFRSNNNYIGNPDLPIEIIKRMKEIDNKHYYTLFAQAAVEKYECNFISSLQDFKNSYELAKKNKNSNRQIQSLMAMYGIYRNTDKKMEELIANELLSLKNNSIPNKIKENINYNIGMQDYLSGRYNRAYELFNENIIEYHSYNCLLFMCSVCSHLKVNFPIALKEKEIEERYDFIYLNYFIKKENTKNYEDLAEYILQEIFIEKLQYEKYREPYWNLFEFELNEMANYDFKIRKYYFEFNNLLKITCKN